MRQFPKIAATVIGFLVILGSGPLATAQTPDKADLDVIDTCLIEGLECTDGGGDGDEDRTSEEFCQAVAQDRKTCNETYPRLSMEIVWIKYCSPECDPPFVTTGSIHHRTKLGGDTVTRWFNNFEDGVDLDPDEKDNLNNNCGEWEHVDKFTDDSDELIGSISQDRSPVDQGGCPTDPAHGFWFTGVDSDAD